MSPHKVINDNAQYIASAVTDAHATYLTKNPIFTKAHANAAEHLPGGNTRTVLFSQPFPLAITSGAGNTLTSADRHNYIDFLGEFSAGLFGHSNALITEAVTNTLTGGWNFGGGNMYERNLHAKSLLVFLRGAWI
jgi:glutamate-1-semialdehyde 2,1-aminomutase